MNPIKKKYRHVTNNLKVLQIDENAISDAILNLMKGKEAFIDADKDIDEAIYYASLFSDIEHNVRMEEIKLDDKFIPSLMELIELAQPYNYIMIRKF